MNKIIYLTTAQRAEDFKNNLSKWSVSPNTSNQNFHNKLIRSLAISHTVDVISVRPINKNFALKKLNKEIIIEDNISWHYLAVKSSKIFKLLRLRKTIFKETSKLANKDVTIIVDTLNQTLLTSAIKLAKKHSCRTIGIVTDSPYNISFTKKNYAEKVLLMGQKLNGFVALTNDLESLYNKSSSVSLIIDGVNDETKKKKPIIEGDYIFFAGSLMHEYGVYNLINTFNSLNLENIKLVICGHHEESNFKDFVKEYKNVVYLGIQDYESITALEQNALLCVNPRPINHKIDNYSIPSKTLEYLANGALTVSVVNPVLIEHYKDVIIWAQSGSVDDLSKAITEALSLNKTEIQKIKKEAKEEVLSRTSLQAIDTRYKELFD